MPTEYEEEEEEEEEEEFEESEEADTSGLSAEQACPPKRCLFTHLYAPPCTRASDQVSHRVLKRWLALQVYSLLDVLCEKTDVVQVELKVSAPGQHHWLRAACQLGHPRLVVSHLERLPALCALAAYVLDGHGAHLPGGLGEATATMLVLFYTCVEVGVGMSTCAAPGEACARAGLAHKACSGAAHHIPHCGAPGYAVLVQAGRVSVPQIALEGQRSGTLCPDPAAVAPGALTLRTCWQSASGGRLAHSPRVASRSCIGQTSGCARSARWRHWWHCQPQFQQQQARRQLLITNPSCLDSFPDLTLLCAGGRL